MNKFKHIGVLLLITAVFCSCEDDKFDIEEYGAITGVILDGETYEPLDGVLVVTNPASTSIITGSDGAFQITKVPEGEVALTAKRKDYSSSTISVAVYDDEETSLTFFLLKDEGDAGDILFYDPVPGNGATGQNTSFTIEWSVDQSDKSVDLEFAVYYFKSNSTTQYIAGENLTDNYVVISGLDINTTYYWYVVAKYEGHRVANSPTWTFRTGSE
jgi:hypothetical protein